MSAPSRNPVLRLPHDFQGVADPLAGQTEHPALQMISLSGLKYAGSECGRGRPACTGLCFDGRETKEIVYYDQGPAEYEDEKQENARTLRNHNELMATIGRITGTEMLHIRQGSGGAQHINPHAVIGHVSYHSDSSLHVLLQGNEHDMDVTESAARQALRDQAATDDCDYIAYSTAGEDTPNSALVVRKGLLQAVWLEDRLLRVAIEGINRPINLGVDSLIKDAPEKALACVFAQSSGEWSGFAVPIPHRRGADTLAFYAQPGAIEDMSLDTSSIDITLAGATPPRWGEQEGPRHLSLHLGRNNALTGTIKTQLARGPAVLALPS